MFTILGTDGKEYGPVSADKVREWIAGGRANAQTQIKPAGAAEWTTIGALPEFSSPPAAGAAVPAVAAPSPGVDAMAAQAGGPLDITGCIKRGFAAGAANYWPILGVSLLVGLCNGIVGAIPILGMVATFTLTGVFYGGLYYYVAKKVRGEPTEIGDAFSGFSVCFGQLVLATLVVMILTIIGFVCLILPGIYLAVCWLFTYVLVRDKGLQFWDAMELGRQVITRQWFRVFGLLLLIGLIALVILAVPVGMILAATMTMKSGGTPSFLLLGLGIAGTLACILVMMPFLTAILLQAYEDLFGSAA
jgi:hypothetical protein